MIKYIPRLYLITLTLLTIASFGQKSDLESYTANFDLNVRTGWSLFQEPTATEFIYDSKHIRSRPTYIVAGNYNLSKKSSIGLMASYLNVPLQYKDAAIVSPKIFYFDEFTTTSRDDIAFKYKEVSFFLFPQYNYINNSKLRLYSGVRVGAFITRANVSDPHPDFDVAKSIASYSTRYGITPIGIVYTIHNHMGISMDLNIGKPYVGSFGLSYKLK